ncbi:hypothetical protein ES703_10345 [subsurface metagenome]|nr:hypothetical protein [bacterium]
MKFAWKLLPLLLIAGLFTVGYAAKRGERSNGRPSDEPFLLVVGIVSGSIADQVGIKEGDILRSYDGNWVQSIEELEAVKKLAVDSVEVIFDRGEETLSFIFPPGQMGLYLEQQLPELEYTSDAVLLQGIGPLDEKEGMNNSFILSLARTANYLKDTLDYTMLMGLSGAAFRLQMHHNWDISAVLASEGYRCDLVALGALGYEYRYLELEENMRNVEAVRDAIIQTVDAGSPVIAFQLAAFPDWGIITGYQKSGREFLVRVYESKRTGYTLAEAFPKKVYLIEGRDVPPILMEAIIRSFAIAQEVLETERIGDYYCGLEVMKNWIQALETGAFHNLRAEDFNRIVDANAWMYKQLAEDRDFAAAYLKRIAPQFPDIQDKLLAIADLYATEAEYLNLAFASEEEMPVVWATDLESQYDWTPQMRMREINYLRFARVKEDEALKIWCEINAIYNPEPVEEEEATEEAPLPEEEQPEEPIQEEEIQPTQPERFRGEAQ